MLYCVVFVLFHLGSLEVYGQFDSPVIPVMIYNPGKIAEFSRQCFKRGVRRASCLSAVVSKQSVDGCMLTHANAWFSFLAH